MFARNTELLEFEGASDEKLLEVTDFGFELSGMGFNSIPYSI